MEWSGLSKWSHEENGWKIRERRHKIGIRDKEGGHTIWFMALASASPRLPASLASPDRPDAATASALTAAAGSPAMASSRTSSPLAYTAAMGTATASLAVRLWTPQRHEALRERNRRTRRHEASERAASHGCTRGSRRRQQGSTRASTKHTTRTVTRPRADVDENGCEAPQQHTSNRHEATRGGDTIVRVSPLLTPAATSSCGQRRPARSRPVLDPAPQHTPPRPSSAPRAPGTATGRDECHSHSNKRSLTGAGRDESQIPILRGTHNHN